MDLRLRDKAVLITGASRGLGRHFALGFADEGAKLALCARNPGRLEEAAAEVRRRGVECVTVIGDLFRPEDCVRVVEEAAAKLGHLDVLVNNASTNVDRPEGETGNRSDAQLTERFLGKTMAAVRCSYAAVPYMRQAGSGRIVCIGGTAAKAALRPGQSGSLFSQMPQGLGNSALANFVKYLSDEVAADQILVNLVQPHFTRTERHAPRVAAWAKAKGISEDEAERQLAAFIPLGRIIEPSDITPLVLLLSSPLTAATTGQSITVDGGALTGVSY
jgi:3-oxoacyl-[acyl-carrier protein] reductase